MGFFRHRFAFVECYSLAFRYPHALLEPRHGVFEIKHHAEAKGWLSIKSLSINSVSELACIYLSLR